MAHPTKKFLNALTPNMVWRGPTPDIADLHAYQTRAPGGDLSLSCWELGPGEYQEVVRTGKVYLYVYGHHPPVWVSSAREVGELLNVPPDDEPSVLVQSLNEARERELQEVRVAARREALEEAAKLCSDESLAWHVDDPNG